MSLPLLPSLISTRTIVFPFEIPYDPGLIDVQVVLCDVRSVGPDAVTVDALARLQLAARRRGHEIRLCHTSRELRELLVFMGLNEVLPESRPRL